MNREDDILKEFQQADEETRLYLFLAHRDLRSDFMALVQQPLEQVSMPAPRASFRPTRHFRRWLLEKLLPFSSPDEISGGNRARV
jgi:hypothetical protein